MALHVCKCSYSTINKSNYNKHIKICKQCIEPITDNIYEENQSKYDTQLAIIKQELEQKLEEQVAMIRKEYENKLEKELNIIRKEYEQRKKKYKCKREIIDEETKVKELQKLCKGRGIYYNKSESSSELKKLLGH